jgi:hypothetical protein
VADQDTRVPAKPDYRELGVSGTRILGGIPYEEVIPALSGMQAYKTYNTMRFDATCSALKKSIELPIRSARWFVEPASDDPKDVDKADFAHWCMYDFGDQSMDDVLRLALGCLDFGFTPLEVCYQYIPEGDYRGKVGWNKLAWRNQSSKWRWNMGEINGMQELVSMTQLAPPFYTQVDIPRNKMLLFVNDLLGDNYDGTSIYRPGYKNWFIRDQLYKIQAIGLERTYMGIPMATLPENYSDEMKTLAMQIVTNLRTDDNAGITKPMDLGIEILHNTINAGTEMQAAITYHSREILKSSLAHFLDLGSAGSSGSWALSSDQSELFLMAINAPANMVEEQFNLEPGIPALMRFNYADAKVGAMPKLTHGDIGQRSLQALGRTLMALGQWGFLTPDDTTEDWFRQVLDMPERGETVDAEALKDLLPAMFPAPDDLGRSHTAGRLAPVKAVGATPVAPQLKAVPGGAPAQPPATGAAALMSELRARAPWERPSGRLTPQERVRIQLSEHLVDTLDQIKRETSRVPERPSIRMARTRRPYVVAMSEKTPKEKIAAINAKAKSGDLKPVGGTQPPKKIVQRHQLAARKQGKDIEKFFKGLKP